LNQRIVIIDDEDQARSALKQELELHCSDVDIVGEGNNVSSGIGCIEKSQPDLVFLDIQLKDGVGFQILDHFEEISFQIVFTTAFSNYALRAIKFSALDYLLKPVDGIELQEVVNKAKKYSGQNSNLQIQNFLKNQSLQPHKKRIALQTSEGIHLYPLDDIVRCSAEGNYTRFYLTSGKKLLIAKTLKEYEEMLSPYHFERIHHSHIVNLHHLTKYLNDGNGYVVMSNAEIVPVAQRKKAALLAILNGIL